MAEDAAARADEPGAVPRLSEREQTDQTLAAEANIGLASGRSVTALNEFRRTMPPLER